MKKISTMIISLIFLFAVTAFAGDNTVAFKTNITCGGCATTIKTAMSKLDGVTNTNVDVASKVVTITYNEKTDVSTIKSTIKKSGYTATEQAAKEIDATQAVKSSDKKCGSDESCCKSDKKKTATTEADMPIKK